MQIEARIRTLVQAELTRRLVRDVLPHNCRHNHRQPLDQRRMVYGEPNRNYNRISAGVVDGESLPVLQTVGLCMMNAESPELWKGTICEDPIDAQRCPWFVQRQSDLDIYEAFVRDLRDTSWLEANLPEVRSLLWVVDHDAMAISPSATERPWWLRLWSWFLAGPLVDMERSGAEISVYLPRPPDGPTSENDARVPVSDGTSPAAI